MGQEMKDEFLRSAKSRDCWDEVMLPIHGNGQVRGDMNGRRDEEIPLQVMGVLRQEEEEYPPDDFRKNNVERYARLYQVIVWDLLSQK
jgi:hypothetical protein